MTEWLTAFDEMYYFMKIFYDKDDEYSLTNVSGTTYEDDRYGFADPVKPIFKTYNITRFAPDVITQFPSLQIVIDDERAFPDVGLTFGENIESELSIYIISLKRETLQYNGETYYIEDANTPKPHENDTIMLLRAFVFQRLEDFKSYSDNDISWNVKDWTGSEFLEGVGGVTDMVALRLMFDVNFEREES